MSLARARWALPALAALLLAPPAGAQQVTERLDLDALAKIRAEATERSQVESLAGHLTDVIGPRLTGSPAMDRANEWAVATFTQWGLAAARTEAWDSAFGRGWERVSYSGRFLAPFVQPLNATSQAWSGSTKGTITCPVVVMEVRDTADLAAWAGRLKGACVLRNAPADIPPEYTPSPRRLDADTLLAPVPERPQGPGQRDPDQAARFRQAQALNRAVAAFLRRERPAAILLPSGWTYNILRTGGHPDGRLARDSAYDPTPALLVSHEHYGQMWRNAKRGVPVRLELNVQNRFLDADRTERNAFAEIPGSDKAGEVVMIGAHFDSWHSGTGATDNGAGSVIMMEAMRILKATGLPMRRTVRIGLWSGEEQGLIGSRSWVRTHRDELARISAYLNVDNGAGRLRGIWTQSNAAAGPVFEAIFSPLAELGVVAVRHGNTGGTDHLAFDAAGVPGFNYIQDPLEYGIRTHHSNADTYERFVMEDLKQAAAVVAWTAYTLANRDEPMPRKPAGDQASTR
ncbi:MAG TPA: M20/M25/M40 family metallo-hydrolase [Gemmatimonadales bacterium]|nr:M20/M25/M40 family metallo-hydrolase [Gemmatimonadales bacterium]